MPLTELEDSINAELDDNPALESENPDDMLANDTNENDHLPEDNDSHNNDEEDDYEAQTEKEEREDALDSALENIGRDDLMPDYNSDRNNKQDADYEEMVYGDTISFYDKLKEQMDMQMLDDTEKQIMEYLIGSLDDDGLLRKDLDSICDELAIYQNIDVSEQKLEKILHILQTFDPAGIGARNLQECLQTPLSTEFSSEDEIVEFILRERQVELVGEGRRWFDLLRTGKWKAVMGPINGLKEDGNEVFPIHFSHIIENPKIKQNTYYGE